MCGVIGVRFGGKKEELIIHLLKQVMIESQIRGKHATGISFIKDGEIETISEPIPSKEFVHKIFEKNFLFKESPSVIAHCRYSTSDIKFNQPISSAEYSIVHNGVITQEAPEKWEEHFDYKCSTNNDSELILKILEDGYNPLLEYEGSSIACNVLTRGGNLMFFRNGQRPLWYCEYEGSTFIASTKDILRRAFLKNSKVLPEFKKAESGIMYTPTGKGLKSSFIEKFEDLQIDLPCSDFYKKIEIDGLQG